MEYGHPVAPSHGHQQTVRPHAPIYDEEPRTEPGFRAVVADEEEHHEKKPVLKKVKDKVKKIKDTITKKRHGHGDDHDDEHYVEGEGYDEEDEEMEVEPEVDDAPQGLYGQHKPFTLDRRDEYIDIGSLDAPESLRTRDNRRGTLTSLDEHVPLGGLQEPRVTPETTLKADSVAPLPYGSVPPTDDNISGSKTAGPTPGNELSVSPDVLSSLQAIAKSVQQESQQKDQHGSNAEHEASDVEKKPSYTEKLSSTAAAAKDAADTDIADHIATPVRTGPGVEVEPREGAEERKGSYTEKLSSTAAAAKDAVVHAASTVYGKVAGDTRSDETRDQVATPVSTESGVEEVARVGAGEKKGTYTEQLSDKEKGGIVLPEVTGGEVDVKRVVGKEGGSDGGKGMVEKIKGAVSSLVGGGGGSGGPAAATEGAGGAGGAAARERAYEEMDY